MASSSNAFRLTKTDASLLEADLRTRLRKWARLRMDGQKNAPGKKSAPEKKTRQLEPLPKAIHDILNSLSVEEITANKKEVTAEIDRMLTLMDACLEFCGFSNDANHVMDPNDMKDVRVFGQSFRSEAKSMMETCKRKESHYWIETSVLKDAISTYKNETIVPQKMTFRKAVSPLKSTIVLGKEGVSGLMAKIQTVRDVAEARGGGARPKFVSVSDVTKVIPVGKAIAAVADEMPEPPSETEPPGRPVFLISRR